MYTLAQSLAGLRLQVRSEAESFPGLRPATRMELYRRLYRGRDFLLSCYDQPLTVAAAARVAGALAVPFSAHVQAGVRADSHAVSAGDAAGRRPGACWRTAATACDLHLLRGRLRKPGVVQLAVPQALRRFSAGFRRVKIAGLKKYFPAQSRNLAA
jgi:hypothetical protein